MNFKNASDDVLIHAIQRQNLDALDELYDRHVGTALAVAYRVLGDKNLAEDVVQETFLAVWRQAGTFTPERGTVRSWLLSIVRHRAIDITRRRSFAKERISLDEIGFEPRYPDAWQEVSSNLERERVRHAISALPAEQSEAIMLSYFGGFTQQEIAERTGVPLGTVKGRIRLGLQKLRSVLIKTETGEAD